MASELKRRIEILLCAIKERRTRIPAAVLNRASELEAAFAAPVEGEEELREQLADLRGKLGELADKWNIRSDELLAAVPRGSARTGTDGARAGIYDVCAYELRVLRADDSALARREAQAALDEHAATCLICEQDDESRPFSPCDRRIELERRITALTA